MRLIDAEALFKEEREEYRNNACYISTDYEHIFAEIDNAPTVEDKPQGDLEAIRQEIEQAADKQFQIAMGVADLNERYTHIQMENVYRHSLGIIDKHLQNPQAVDERVDEKVDRAFDKLLEPFQKGEN